VPCTSQRWLLLPPQHFDSPGEASKAGCEVAEHVFHHPSVTSVFLGPSWVSVNATEGANWEQITRQVEEAVALGGDGPLFSPEVSESSLLEGEYRPEDTEIVQEIYAVLQDYVRPAVQEDGGDIFFV
jgi:NFU1 iron-sulfur cluster scaffold homolog, mitochondrial